MSTHDWEYNNGSAAIARFKGPIEPFCIIGHVRVFSDAVQDTIFYSPTAMQ